MVDFKKLSTRAKDLVEKRGGPEGIKRDAGQLREIAKSKGTLSDKAKAAAAALKEAQANDPAQPAGDAAPVADTRPKVDPEAPGTAGHEPTRANAAGPGQGRKADTPSGAPGGEPTR